ncbi:MAG TPA: hypothetical protein PLV05_11450 [Verrucomicrobiota bacterium]|jgi:hypothetical protein|nr:hypothetical protein [Verrucomicrobiota bacterium]OQC23960.1 MAG: hypothetical protein BWX68_02497 [Verrucomicrobia bacterium ADurb.Bin063]HCL91466.1 hypothetical protein [Limisphaerales bacterium]HRR65391.1 hypothetical protein [Candidatus Paceibacterota bacterium]MBP8015059.1 hypothetical protein [Verrucomicrobiota bacterium]
MAAIQIQSTKGEPITVVYPAERASAPNTAIQLRIGKKTLLPAYSNANLPHLVQFQRERQVTLFMLADVLETSYWRKLRNAFTIFGQLDMGAGVKVSAGESRRVVQWLRELSAARRPA